MKKDENKVKIVEPTPSPECRTLNYIRMTTNEKSIEVRNSNNRLSAPSLNDLKYIKNCKLRQKFTTSVIFRVSKIFKI